MTLCHSYYSDTSLELCTFIYSKYAPIAIKFLFGWSYFYIAKKLNFLCRFLCKSYSEGVNFMRWGFNFLCETQSANCFLHKRDLCCLKFKEMKNITCQPNRKEIFFILRICY